MSVKSYWYTHYFSQIIAASPTYGGWKAAAGDAFKIALMTPSFIPNQDTQATYSQLSNQVVGPGYDSGGKLLTSKTLSLTAGNLVIGAADVTWGNCTFITNRAVIYDDTNPLPASKQLMLWIDFGQELNLNNQTLQLTFDGQGNVTVVVLPPPDVTAPTLGTAGINANPLILTFSEPLNPQSVSATTAFTVLVNAAPRVVNAVLLTGSNVSLTLASDVISTDTVTVAYTAPVLNPLEDLAGNDVASFTAQPVSNQTSPPADLVPPDLVEAVCVGNQITLSYDEQLNQAVVPATTSYAVVVAGSADTVSSVSVLGSTVVLLLTTSASQGQTVTLSYTPGANKIQDSSGNLAAALVSIGVINNSPDIIPPVLSSATIDTSTLVLTYSKPLNSSYVPAASSYVVTVNSVAQASPTLVVVAGSTVTLTTAAPVIDTSVVKLAYTRPPVNSLRDLSGNVAGNFTNFTVQNITAPAPVLVDNAAFVSQSIPDLTVDTGTVQAVNVVMNNSGTTSWNSSGYQLRSQNPAGNTTWGLSTVAVPNPTPPASNANFGFNITAPSTAGNYNFQWRMHKIGGADFGASSSNIVIAVSTPVPSGRTLWVSTTGNDNNAGTQSAPFRTINKAASVVVPGDTVRVMPGIYTEAKGAVSGYGSAGIYTYVHGTASKRIRFISNTKWGAIIRPSSAVFYPWLNMADYIDIQDFDLSNLLPTSTAEPSILNTYASYGNFVGNHIHDCPRNCGSGIGIRGIGSPRFATQNNVIGNRIHDLGYTEPILEGHRAYAVYFSYGDGLIANNVFYRTNSYVLHLYHGPNGVNVVNNVACYSANASGIVIGGQEQTAKNIYVANNIFAYNSYSGSRVFGVTDYATIVFENNLYLNTTDTSYSGAVTETGLVHADPKFVSTTDFHLTTGSPAINTGVNKYALSTYLRTDYAGTPRPSSGAWERGAYEF